MIKWIEATGKTEDAAIAAALAQLGLERDEVSVEILDRAKSGFLGLGGTPARIKMSYEAPDEPVPAPAPPAEKPAPKKVETADSAPKGPAKGQQRENRQAPKQPAAPAASPVSVQAAGQDERAEKICAFLSGLMDHMGISAEPKVEGSPEEGYKVELTGKELGGLIGRRGETLDAIQQLTNYAVNRGQSKRVRIHIDAEKYRAKREESLQRLARKVADKVVKYRRNVTLEPMNAYERHVIHATLQDYPDVATYSMGTEPNRRTVVAYSRGEHKY